ncbi:hypothetical protein [Cellvibrio sp. UBA7661]
MLTYCLANTSGSDYLNPDTFWLRSRSPLCQRHPFFTDPPASI